MYLSCIKNYVNSLKYTMTVLGILALGIVIGLGCFGKMSGQAIGTMTETMKTDYDAADLKLSYITDAVVDRVQNITLGDILNIIHERSLEPLLIGPVKDSVSKVVENYQNFAERIIEDIERCVEAITVALMVGLVLIVLGQVAGFFTVEICIRRKISSVGIPRLLLEMLVRFLMYAVALFIVFGLCTAFPKAATPLLCLIPILLVFFGLLAAWLTSNPKKTNFKKVVSFANFGWLLLADLTMLAATALIGYAVYRLLNIAAALLLGVSLLTILLVAMDLSAAAAAVRAEEKETKLPEETAKELPAEETAQETAAAPLPVITEPTDAEMAVPETPLEIPVRAAEPLQNEWKKKLQDRLTEE